ncbi:MAG: hypothetical protein WC728_09535 [Elusimicrobiota bacterium]
MLRADCTFLKAFSAYVFLVALTWSFTYSGAHAAQKLRPRSIGQGFDSLQSEPEEEAGEEEEEEAPAPRAQAGGQTTYQKIRHAAGAYDVEYGFKNFNNDKVRIQASISDKVVADSVREFGYRKADFDKLDAWYQTAQEQAIASSSKRTTSGRITAANQAELDRKMRELKASNARIQQELDATLKGLAAEYRRKRLALYEQGGFRMKEKGVVEVDIPALVRKNWSRMRPVAQSFVQVSNSRSYDQEELVGAVAAMVQTAMRYEVPDTTEGDRVIGGVLPPMRSLIMGQGDCDTKTAVLSSILANWPNLKMVGLAIPGHYLMAVHRIPRSGDVFIEHEGIPYVMIESAGPAWLPPGKVGDSTEAYLSAGNDFRIQKL